MSSKVYRPDDDPAVTPVAWRQVGRAPAGERAADSADRLAQLESQYQAKIRDAHTAGLREGETAGRNRAQADLRPVVERLARSIEEISNLRSRLRWEAEADVVQLALAVARRVLRRELAADPDALRGLVMAALDKLRAQEIARVRIHPAQAGLLESCLQNASRAMVEILPDPACEPGSVIFETPRGNLDASVESQLQEIERGLADRLRRQG